MPASTGRQIVTLAYGLLALAILAVAGWVAMYWLNNRPHAERRRPEPTATLVEVAAVERATHRVEIEALGTVIPAREVVLAPRVGGELIEVSDQLLPGGRFQAGDLVARIDPQDYELAVQERTADLSRREAELEQMRQQAAQREADVVRAESDLRLEMGRQQLAQDEAQLLGEMLEESDRELVLRRPQLAAARADCDRARAARDAAQAACRSAEALAEAARAQLERARLDLERTSVRAPFNAVVISRQAQLGALVVAGSALVTLVGTDACWVELALPVDALRWITTPAHPGDAGSAVRIYHEAAWGPGVFRDGEVTRLAADLEPQGRLAQVLVTVVDPLGLQTEPGNQTELLLGAYVRGRILGHELEGVVTLPRRVLREDGQVWVMSPDRTLEIRDVEIAWEGRHQVCIRHGLEAGDLVVVSVLTAPVAGMPLRTVGEPAATMPGSN